MEHLDQVLSSDIGRHLLQQLPPDALVALLSSDKLAVACENSVIAAIDVWLSGSVAQNQAELDGSSTLVARSRSSSSSSSSSACSCSSECDVDIDDVGYEEAAGHRTRSEMDAPIDFNDKSGLQQLLDVAENVAQDADPGGYGSSYSSSSSSSMSPRNACCCSSCLQQQSQPLIYIEPAIADPPVAPANSSSTAVSGSLQQTVQLLMQQVRLPLCSGAFLAAAAAQLPWLCQALRELPDLRLMQQYYR
jgi:hypothetical protein